ncbi:pyridoxal phosphate-dependent decarboxylase family protein [Streptomyces sp. WMMC905]|uniref:pyridoxal phosphate-dependent decarboxylase family protein n=1 Tax=Streptomyces sp. WMMC905 TaxID=3404123 RepID=UPI003B93E80C
MSSLPPLASGVRGPQDMAPLVDTVLDALRAGTALRRGPFPAGGPEAVAARLRKALGDVLPEHGEPGALRALVAALAEGAADPAHPLCAAHLHCPPLAVAVAADLAADVLNPSLDSWDQAPAAAEVESAVGRALAGEVGAADAVATTGATESNHLALLFAREIHGPGVRLVYGANAHDSLPRAAWLLGLPDPVVVPAPGGTIDLAALDQALTDVPGPHLVAATAGTTDAGLLDPLGEIADRCAVHGARFHVDAAYGGGLLFSERRRALLGGLDRADTVALDLHKLGWQPIPAGLLTVRDPADLTPLHHHTDYLNAVDDTEAGLPDLLGRSPRTSRRPDCFKIAVTLRTLGRRGLGDLVDRVCDHALRLADRVREHPRLELHAAPTLSTVLFRPSEAPDSAVAELRRLLLLDGSAVLGRARLGGRLWLKATLLNPHLRPDDLDVLLDTVDARGRDLAHLPTRTPVGADRGGVA